MIRKILFSFLLLIFSVVNFLQAQNMWQQYHLPHDNNSISFVDQYVWIGYTDGAIRIDTTNWNIDYFDFTTVPEMIIGGGLTTIPSVSNVLKLDSGKIGIMQMGRSIKYDGVNFNSYNYPSSPSFIGTLDETVFYDSSGMRWYNDGSFAGNTLRYDDGVNWTSPSLGFYNYFGIDTAGCFYSNDIWGNNDYWRICGLNNIAIEPWLLPGFYDDYKAKFSFQNVQWFLKTNTLQLSKIENSIVTNYQVPDSFPGAGTPDFYPWKGDSVLFSYGELLFLFDGVNLNPINTPLNNIGAHNKGVAVSPSGRIFSISYNCYPGECDGGSTEIFSSIDGINWQTHNYSNLDLYSGNQMYWGDSSGVVYGFQSGFSNFVRWKNGWTKEVCPIPIPSSDIAPASDGSCWILDIGSSVPPFSLYHWKLNNSIDTFEINDSQYSRLMVGNGDRVWYSNFPDTIKEFDGTSVLNTYIGNSILFGTGGGMISYLDQMVLGNAFYLVNDDSDFVKYENGFTTNISTQFNQKFTNRLIAKDLLGNMWVSTKTAMYRWNGIQLDSIQFPINCSSCVTNYGLQIFFSNMNIPFVWLPTNNPDYLLGGRLFKYEDSTWSEILKPTPVMYGGFFPKDNFLWTFNGSSLIRFDPNGIPNLISNTFTSSGNAYHDLNSNNIQNTNESGKQNVLIQSSSGDFSFTQLNGNYLILCDSGQNTITCALPLYYNSSPASIVINNTGANPYIDSVDFALQPLPGMNDLSVDVTHYPFITWNTNPGISYWVTVKNPGTTVQSATLTFNVPDTLVIAYVYPAPTSTNGNQLTWSLNNLAIDTTLQFYIAASFQLPTPIGSTLIATAEVQSAITDLTPANNIDTVSYLVTGPYDPNMKLVDPMGEGALGITDTTHHVFTYTVYFQNTGNDTAVNVRVDDFLDADFDWTSFNLISSSSPVDFDLNQNGLLRFQFNNIFLPDSNVNEPMSHGFVKYSLRLKPGPSLGKQLTNAASIYFDYQPPIFTNSTLNTIGMETGIGALSYNSNSVTLFPNPSDGFVNVLSNRNKMNFIAVYDLSGRLCYTQEASTNQATINIQSLAQGLYLVKIKLQNGATELKKLVKE